MNKYTWLLTYHLWNMVDMYT